MADADARALAYLGWRHQRDRLEDAFPGYTRCMSMSLADLRALWDSYDGSDTSDPEISGEAVYMALNMRGDGGYCAV